jgi:D-glycero-D-manno-heptose 1,7-bisphosphate phosphatase
MVSEEAGLFARRLSSADYAGQPCLFLDRDGVLVEESNYLHRAQDAVIIDGVAEAISSANAAGLAVVMVTNQAGIGRGYYDWDDFERVQRHILEAYCLAGASFDLVLACAYHHEAVSPYRHEAHPWRKPAPGMLLEAARVLGIDLAKSHIVGDTLTDLAAGARAGLRSGTLVLTGHGSREWNDGGEAAFTSLKTEGEFTPHLARNAAHAIENWLAEVLPGNVR